MSEELSCRDVADFLLRYVESDLPEKQLVVFEEHLAMCPPCIHYVESYRKTIALGKAACAEDAPEMPEGLVQGILHAMKKGPASE
jgi:anti-sigma factor RsiW